MTTSQPSRSPLAADGSRDPYHLTLGDVIAAVAGHPELTAPRRRDLASAVRTIARALGRPPAEIPANPRYLRERLDGLSAAAAGVGDGRWRNLRSLLGTALTLAGVKSLPGRYVAPLGPRWAAHFAIITDRRMRSGLSRLIHWCDTAGIGPDAVDDAVIGQFAESLHKDSFVRKPKGVHRLSCQLWNRAATEIAGWPQHEVGVPNHKADYTLAWEAFPPSLRADVEACLAQAAGDDLLADEAPLRPIGALTRRQRHGQLRRLATALVLSGTRLATEVTTLGVLVEVASVRAILRFLLERAKRDGRTGKKPTTGHIHQLARLLKTVARHWVKVDEQHFAELHRLCRRVDPRDTGMTDKNRDRLRPLRDAKVLRAFLELPDRMLAEVRRTDRGRRREALEVATALGIAILTYAPIRSANLCRLDLERHLIRTRAAGTVFIVIPAHEVKNAVDLEVELPEPVVALLDLYIEHYRPRLIEVPSTLLFPGRYGGPSTTTAERIPKAILRHLGIDFHVHLFRHLAAMIHLTLHPGDYETVRRVLGHKSMDTTARTYAGLETAAAFAHYDRSVLQLREAAR